MSNSVWVQVKDGNETGRELFGRHYTYRPQRNQINLFPDKNRNYTLFVGPGEKMVLITADGLSLFAWRKFKSMDSQRGLNCSVFRNDGSARASDLILAAEDFARQRWPDETRYYTYVDPRKVRRSRTPGRCFLKAGWRYQLVADGSRYLTNKGLLVLEKFPDAKIPELEFPD